MIHVLTIFYRHSFVRFYFAPAFPSASPRKMSPASPPPPVDGQLQVGFDAQQPRANSRCVA